RRLVQPARDLNAGGHGWRRLDRAQARDVLVANPAVLPAVLNQAHCQAIGRLAKVHEHCSGTIRARFLPSEAEPLLAAPASSWRTTCQRNCIRLAKTCSKSPSLLAFSTWRLRPSVRAAACEARATGPATVGWAGLMRSPTPLAAGTSSRTSSSRFGAISKFKLVTPVMLPPGRFRLATRPSWIGSPAVSKTTGTVAAAALAASTAGTVVAAITAT